jgi:hypothetical protein
LGPLETYLESARVVGVSLISSVIVSLTVSGGDFSEMVPTEVGSDLDTVATVFMEKDYCGIFISYGIVKGLT